MSRARRNIGILAHIDAGKTTVTEQLLHLGPGAGRPGSVDSGTTVTDWMVEEQERGITIASAASSFRWRDVDVTVVDTPGHVDFTIEVERSLRVLDGAVIVISGPDRVQPQTETVWVQACRYALPAIGYVNKLDRDGFDPDAVLASIRERLGITPVPLQIPIVSAETIALVDVITGQQTLFDREDQSQWRSDDLDEDAQVLRLEAIERLVDAIASHDDAYAELVLAGGEPTPAEHLRALARAVAARAVLPLVFGAARHGLGLGALADAIVDLLPAPGVASMPAFDRAGHACAIVPTDATSAYVFKTEPRRRGKRLAFVRVITGAIESGADLVRTPMGDALAPARPVHVTGQDYDPVPRLEAGAIGALEIEADEPMPRTGDTLGNAVLPFTFERLRPPEPVLELTVEAPDAGGHERMVAELALLCADDPSLRLGVDRDTGRAKLSGMGELHLEIAIERAARALGFPLRAGTPRIRERGVLLAEGTGEATVQHPTGRARVRVVVAIAPLATLAVEVPELERPDFRDAVISGLEAAAGVDGRGQRPLLGGRLRAEIEAHGTDVVPIMFRDAAEWAALRAIESAGLGVAEPWCALTVIVPDAAVGRVVGDLARRRARVRHTESRGPVQELALDAPLAELVGYASDLRSLTAGRGQFSIEPVGYRASERREEGAD